MLLHSYTPKLLHTPTLLHLCSYAPTLLRTAFILHPLGNSHDIFLLVLSDHPCGSSWACFQPFEPAFWWLCPTIPVATLEPLSSPLRALEPLRVHREGGDEGQEANKTRTGGPQEEGAPQFCRGGQLRPQPLHRRGHHRGEKHLYYELSVRLWLKDDCLWKLWKHFDMLSRLV